MSALRGVRVLDLCIILAGPTCGRTLGEFGADVIKIDDPTRILDPVGYIDVNRGKRSIMLNLKTDEGRAVFWKLVESADVIVENNRKSAVQRLGLGYEEVKKVKPGHRVRIPQRLWLTMARGRSGPAGSNWRRAPVGCRCGAAAGTASRCSLPTR